MKYMRTTRTSLFRKYMFMTMSILLMSYLICGSIMMAFFGKFWRNEKHKLLMSNAQSVADFASEYIRVYTGDADYEEIDLQDFNIDPAVIESFMDTVAENIDADIFITDVHGHFVTGTFNCSHLELGSMVNVSSDMVARVLGGRSEFNTNFDGTYPRNYYTVSVTFDVLDNTGEPVTSCMVFAATQSNGFTEYQYQTLRIFLISALVTLGIAFFFVWTFTYKLTKPLRQMSAAARAFGNGDFSVRVPSSRDDEIGELGLAFNNMANSLAGSEGMRRSFIANVSHELKTPMTTIAGFIDGILDGTIPKEKEDHYLKIVSDEVKRLSRLVRSMLDLSRIDSGELKLNPVKFDLADTVFQTLLTFEQVIEEKEINIEGLEDAVSLNITGDKDLLHQVVYNLIENAVKFTQQGGYIRFTMADSIDRVSVSIQNSGIGIASEELPMVFERFYKTDKSRSYDKKGMGLGLYLCRTIIKYHGGDISVSSVENEYCRFDFYIPKPKEKAKVPEAEAAYANTIDEVEDADIKEIPEEKRK